MADIVTLDVGGVVYRTKRATLTRYPDSMLGAMFSGRHDVTTDDQGRCFIDGDGSLFRYVLNFLRRSELALPEDFKELDMLRKEAAFYQLQPLVDAIENCTRERRPEQRKIEYLQLMNSEQSRHWMLRGEKRTVDMILEGVRLSLSQWEIGDVTLRCESSRINNYTNTHSDIITASVNLRAGSFLYIHVLTTRLWNIIFDLGLTLKSSTLRNNHQWYWFERCN